VRPLLMMVTDLGRLESSGDAAALVRGCGRAARAGATMIQVRERSLDDRTLFDLTVAIVRETAAAGARVVVNDRLDVATAAGAAGVHLPARGTQPDRVRAAAPAGFLIGRSVHTIDEAVTAERSGACDYLIFGTVFETIGKPPGHPAAGVEMLAAVCAAVSLPVIAIGGVVAARAREVAASGAAGIAGIGLFLIQDEDALRAGLRGIEDAFSTT
jgi:thiamine-phosphate diphosphorylase